jgi:hypothetical protein
MQPAHKTSINDMKNFDATLLKKNLAAGGRNGVLEWWSIGVLGFRCITPLLHDSNIPVTFDNAQGNRHRSRFQQPSTQCRQMDTCFTVA